MKSMSLSRVILALTVATLPLMSGRSAAEEPVPTTQHQDVASRIAAVENGLTPSVRIKGGPVWNLVERMEHLGVPGLAIAVINDYEIEWVKGYGVTDAAPNTPVTEETLFQAASISKPVAAAVALHYVDEGLLDLDEDVDVKLLSWKVPENEFTRTEKVTLRRILSHTAGLTVSGFRGYADGEPVPDILEVLDGKPPANSDSIRVDVTPGSVFRYSGGGYTVLQLLLQDVTGLPVYELTDELVFKPAGMAHSSFQKPLPEALLEKTSLAHRADGSAMAGHWFLDKGSTCCGLWTTPADLARFAIEIQRALKGESGRIVSPGAARLMVTPQPPGQAGLGMFVTERNGAVYFTHSGGNPGFRCKLVGSVDGGRGVAVMTNSDNGGALCEMIAQTVAGLYQWTGYLDEEFQSAEHLVGRLREMKAEDPDDPDVSEGGLNNLGYELLGSGQGEAAVAVLALNVEFCPKSANCYDSLAEAYMTGGDNERAIEFYEKALAALDQYPEQNKPYERLRETTDKQLEKLRRTQ